MSAAKLDNLLEALQPDWRKTSFPVPRLVRGQGSGGVFTSESLTLAGTTMPGQWLLTECTRTFGWQVQKAYGLSGATVLPIGDDPLEMTFALKLWASTDCATYLGLLKTILRKPVTLLPGSTSSAGMGIDQPQVKALGVTAVVVKSVTPPMNPLVTSGGKGAWTATVKFLEYRAPLPALPKPNQATPDRAPPSPSAQDLLDTENARLASQFAAKTDALKRKFVGGPTP